MKRISAEFLIQSEDIIRKKAGVSIAFKALAGELPMDCVRVEFTADGLQTTIAETYASEERWHFFAVRGWQVMSSYLLKLKAFNSELTGVSSLWLDDLPTGPGLVLTLTDTEQQLALPDPMFLASNAYENAAKMLMSNQTSWADKSRKIYWRGASTGYRSRLRPDWRLLPRMRLCSEAAKREDIFDVGISNIVQIGAIAEIEAIKQSGWLKGVEPLERYLDYRYTVDIDGNANSWPGLFTKLLFGCTVLKVASEGGFSQWYYNSLKPWKHFVPIESDLSDLIEKATWVQSNDDIASAIALAGQQFASALTVESTLKQTSLDLANFIKR